ncbi:MAG: hypothetical protein ACLSG5_03975 [Oscillospiraceae bacterium]
MTSDGVHDHVTTDDLESIISNAGSDPDVLRRMISGRWNVVRRTI